MTLRQRLRTLAVCAMLECAALTGMAMRPEDIQELMRTMHQPKLAHVIPDDNEHGDPEPDNTEN
mgnify:FL=1